MTLDIQSMEALAHYTRGGVTIFFVFWCFLLRKYEKRSYMLKLLYFSSLLIAVCYAKDVLFAFTSIKYSTHLNNISGILDMVYIPVISAFFLEVVRPGAVSMRQTWALVAFLASFALIYVFLPFKAIELIASCVAFAISAITLVYVTVFAVRYRKMLYENYSYTENVDVVWVMLSCYAYFGSFVLYELMFQNAVWLSDVIFNISGMVLWTIVFKFAQRHRVLKMFFLNNGSPADDTMGEEAAEEELETEQGDTDEAGLTETEADMRKQERYKYIESRIPLLMEQEKLFLMPKLTIMDLATKIGTNKTYLSEYLNSNLNMSFHDFVNKYRVEEACRIIDALPKDSKRTIIDISNKSGFNSISSFYRQFAKFKGINPRKYLFEKMTKAEENE